MERAVGTLKRRRKRSPAPDDILKLAFAMACTLALLNEIGMIHGDLKPANILLGDGGWPLVADYGCAVIHDDFIAYDIGRIRIVFLPVRQCVDFQGHPCKTQ